LNTLTTTPSGELSIACRLSARLTGPAGSPTETNTFFGNEAIDGGIDLNDRSEFYVPWTQNRGNVNQMFLGTYRMYRTDNAEAPSAGDVTWTPVSGSLLPSRAKVSCT